MKLRTLIDELNKLYCKYGNVDVMVDFQTGGDGNYSFYNGSKLLTYSDETPDTLFTNVLIEEILSIDEVTNNTGKVTGIVLNNYRNGGNNNDL